MKLLTMSFLLVALVSLCFAANAPGVRTANPSVRYNHFNTMRGTYIIHDYLHQSNIDKIIILLEWAHKVATGAQVGPGPSGPSGPSQGKNT